MRSKQIEIPVPVHVPRVMTLIADVPDEKETTTYQI